MMTVYVRKGVYVLFQKLHRYLELFRYLSHVVDQVIDVDRSRRSASARTVEATGTERCRIRHLRRVGIYLNCDL